MRGAMYDLAMRYVYAGIFTDRSKIAMGNFPKPLTIIQSKSNPGEGEGRLSVLPEAD